MTAKTHHFVPRQYFPKSNQFIVLVVDDLPVNRVLLSKILSNAGYKIVESGSGEHALQLIMSGEIRPDVIVTDVEMPEMDGITLTGHIRTLEGKAGRIPIIVASGNPCADMELDAYEAGADSFLCKPFDLKELRDEVAELINNEHNIRNAVRRLKKYGKRGINEFRTRLN